MLELEFYNQNLKKEEHICLVESINGNFCAEWEITQLTTIKSLDIWVIILGFLLFFGTIIAIKNRKK